MSWLSSRLPEKGIKTLSTLERTAEMDCSIKSFEKKRLRDLVNENETFEYLTFLNFCLASKNTFMDKFDKLFFQFPNNLNSLRKNRNLYF